ncbi:hypothetical protein LXL04_020491 [Taraxacum kok-saghyz]
MLARLHWDSWFPPARLILICFLPLYKALKRKEKDFHSISTQCEEIVDHQAVKYDGGAVRRSKLFPFTLFFFNLLFIMLNENEFESVKGSGGCVDAVSAAIETLEHHCRNCGDIFCDKCTQGRIALTVEENAQQVRVCDQCMAEVTQRLSHVNEVAANKASGFNRHEDVTSLVEE